MSYELKTSILEEDSFIGWQRYPANVSNLATVNVQSYYEKISELRSDLFCESSLQTSVQVIETHLAGKQDKPTLNYYHTSAGVEHHILKTGSYGTRIISLHSQNSLEPLNVTEECLFKILTHHDVGAEFLDAIFSLGGKPKDSDVGIADMMIRHRSDGSYDMCYLLVYAEESKGKGRTSWPIRQTVVFHRHMLGDEGNLWILVHPMPDSVLQQRLNVSIAEGWQSSSDHSFQQLHLMAMSSYIDDSRWYLKSLSDEYEEIAGVALTLDFSRPADYSDGFKTLSQLQYLQERILPLQPRFESTAATITELRRVNDIFDTQGLYNEELSKIMSNNLSLYARKIRGYNTSTDLLQSRAQGIIRLLSVSLSLKNQATSVDINHNMLLLTKDTVDDSATVRVVTLVTLIYLPVSFVCSLFGTNFFTFESSEGSGFQISGQFWIFIALTVPLTILTLGLWFYLAHIRRRNKAQQVSTRSQQSGIV